MPLERSAGGEAGSRGKCRQRERHKRSSSNGFVPHYGRMLQVF